MALLPRLWRRSTEAAGTPQALERSSVVIYVTAKFSTMLSPTPKAVSLPAQSEKPPKVAASTDSIRTALSIACSSGRRVPTGWDSHQISELFIGPVRPRAAFSNLITTKPPVNSVTESSFMKTSKARGYQTEWLLTRMVVFGRHAGQALR